MFEGLQQRIQERLDALDKSPRAASLEAGMSASAIRDLFRRPENSPTLESIRKLAGALDTTPEWLAFGLSGGLGFGGAPKGSEDAASVVVPAQEASLLQGVSAFKVAAYGGIVEAGSFRTIDDLEDDPERAPFWEPADREYPDLPLVYFDVRGDSMNALKPRPILPGDRVIAIEFEAFRGNFALRDGIVVVVEQTRDGGHVRERSLKQVELYEDRVEFHPRSSTKKHKPIVVPKAVFADPSEGDGRVVAILALARRISNELEL